MGREFDSESRRLDADIAEKVMGFQIIKTWDGGTEPPLNAFRELYIGGDQEEIPHYSTDIAAAFQVVEKMREKGYRFELITYDTKKVSAEFFKSGDGVNDTFAEGGIPECIVRAALSAIDAKGKEAGK